MTYIITLSLLIIAVIAIRAIFRGSVSPKMIYALWLVVLLKLCMPFSLFSVALPSIGEADINETQHETGSSALPEVTGPMIQNGTETDITDNTAGNAMSSPAADAEIPDFGQGPGAELPVAAPDNMDNTLGTVGAVSSSPSVGDDALSGTAARKIPITSILKSIWVCGSALLALWFALTAAVLSSRVRGDRSRIGRYKGLSVYVSEKVGTPCLRGLIPSVYLTPKAFESEGRRLILAHEYTHLCHGDHIWSFFRIAALVLFWWNPLVWAAALLSKQDAELACDYSLGKRMNDEQRMSYARIIVDMLPVKRRLANGFGGGAVKERIIMMTKKNKNRMLSAVLALALIILAASCSFVGIKEGEETRSDDTTENMGDIGIEPEDEELCYSLISNDAGFDIKQITFDNATSSYSAAYFGKDRYLYRIDRTATYGNAELILIDLSLARILATKTVYVEDFPNLQCYKDGDYIMYNSYYDTEIGGTVVNCAYKVTYENGELVCRDTAFTPFPMCESFIESEDCKIRVYKTVDDEAGHGGIDIVSSDGRVERIAENIMLDDIVDGKSVGIEGVKGYTPIEFLDRDRFIYRVGGWEWTWGYGIYNISTGEKTEYLNGLGFQARDHEGNFYVNEVLAYEPKNYYKITPDGEEILIASYDEDAPDGVVKLEHHSNMSVDFFDNYGSIHEFNEDGVHTYTLTTPDLKTELLRYELDHSKGYISTHIRDGLVTFIVFGNEPVYPYNEESELTEIFKQFLAGGVEGESGEVLKSRMKALTGWSDENFDNEKPQQYFTKWQDKAIELYTTVEHERLKAEQPEYYLLGSLTEKYFDYYKYFGFIPNSNAELVMTAEPWDMTYYYLCRDRNDPKKIYAYYTKDFGRNSYRVDMEIPIEYDTATPIFMYRISEQSDVCRLIYMLTRGAETFHVTLDNEGTDSIHRFKYVGITDQELLENVVGTHNIFEQRVDIGGGHQLQIELKYDKRNIEKSHRAAYSYENDGVNELYMWSIVKIFGDNSRYALIASDRYPAWVIADIEKQTVTNAFPHLDSEIIERIENVETHDGDQFVIRLDDGRVFYHESNNRFTVDIEKMGIVGADYVEMADRSTLVIFKVKNGYADIYTHHTVSGAENTLFKNIPWNENDPKALKLYNSKGYGTYFIRDALYIVDFRTGYLNPTGIEYANGMEVIGLNENVVNIKWEGIQYLTRGVPVR